MNATKTTIKNNTFSYLVNTGMDYFLLLLRNYRNKGLPVSDLPGKYPTNQ